MLQRPVHSGVLSAFAGSVAMAALIVLAGAIDLTPRSGTIPALSSAVGAASMPAAGWFAFFILFTLLWGCLYGAWGPRIPGRSATTRGLLFGFVAWLVMMLVIMPLAHLGWFASEAGVGTAIWSLFIHLVYGVVLASFFAWLTQRHAARTADTWPGGKGF
jgi:hypothetical protein